MLRTEPQAFTAYLGIGCNLDSLILKTRVLNTSEQVCFNIGWKINAVFEIHLVYLNCFVSILSLHFNVFDVIVRIVLKKFF